MENKILEKAKTYYFLVVAVMMYYFLTEQLELGLYIAYRHVFALVLFVSAMILFHYRTSVYGLPPRICSIAENCGGWR